MKVCKYCGTENEEKAKKCAQCGAMEFSHKCENCGTIFDSNNCPNCGVAAGAAPRVCPNCGRKTFSTHCPDCGTSLVKSNNQPHPNIIINNVPNTATVVQPVPQKKPTSFWWRAFRFFMLLGFPLAGVWMYLAGKEVKKGQKIAAVIWGVMFAAAAISSAQSDPEMNATAFVIFFILLTISLIAYGAYKLGLFNKLKQKIKKD